jgi:hypothetical protein
MEFKFYELRDEKKDNEYRQKHPVLYSKKCIVSSDAHFLWDIGEAEHFIELPESNDAQTLRSELFSYLRGV